MTNWLINFYSYLLAFLLLQGLIHWVVKPVYYRLSGKEKIDQEAEIQVRRARVRSFVEVLKGSEFSKPSSMNPKYFGYNDTHHFWQEITDHEVSLLKYFRPFTGQEVYIVREGDDGDE